MSIVNLIDDYNKPWLDARVSDLHTDGNVQIDGNAIIDGTLTVNGIVFPGNSWTSENIAVTITDSSAVTVGTTTAWFFYSAQASGHQVLMYCNLSSFTNITASTPSFTFAFATAPTHYPNSPISTGVYFNAGASYLTSMFTFSSVPVSIIYLGNIWSSGATGTMEGFSLNYHSAT